MLILWFQTQLTYFRDRWYIVILLFAGTIPPGEKSARRVLEDLQHPIHRRTRCPGGWLPANTE